jgi:hypothetical protein
MPKGTPPGFVGLGDPGAVRSDRPTLATPTPEQTTEKSSWKAQRRAVPLYITHDAWRQLRRLSVETERSMNNLLIDGLNTVFAAHGLKTTEDLGE